MLLASIADLTHAHTSNRAHVRCSSAAQHDGCLTTERSDHGCDLSASQNNPQMLVVTKQVPRMPHPLSHTSRRLSQPHAAPCQPWSKFGGVHSYKDLQEIQQQRW